MVETDQKFEKIQAALKEWNTKKAKSEKEKNLVWAGERSARGKVQSLKNLKDRGGNYVLPHEEYFAYLLDVTEFLKKLFEKLVGVTEDAELSEKEKKKLWARLYKYRDEIRALNEEDALFYIQQQIYYMRDYPDLNMSSDLDNLHSLIMEQIFQKKCRKKMALFNTKSSLQSYQEMSKLVRESFARMQKHELNLNMRRRDRKEEDVAEDEFFEKVARKIAKRQLEKKDELREAVQEFKREEKAGEEPR